MVLLSLFSAIVYAWGAVWHGTDWAQSGKVITPKEIAENFEYLYTRINTLEQEVSSAASTTKQQPCLTVSSREMRVFHLSEFTTIRCPDSYVRTGGSCTFNNGGEHRLISNYGPVRDNKWACHASADGNITGTAYIIGCK